MHFKFEIPQQHWWQAFPFHNKQEDSIGSRRKRRGKRGNGSNSASGHWKCGVPLSTPRNSTSGRQWRPIALKWVLWDGLPKSARITLTILLALFVYNAPCLFLQFVFKSVPLSARLEIRLKAVEQRRQASKFPMMKTYFAPSLMTFSQLDRLSLFRCLSRSIAAPI